MKYGKLKRLIVLLVFMTQSVFAQDINPGNTIIEGILGKYRLQEKWDFYDKVIPGQTNFFGDEIQLAVSKELFDRAKSDLISIDKEEVLEDSEAIFYIFRKNEEPMVLYGSIMSGAQDMNDYHSAGITIITPDSILFRLKELPQTTLVYGIDKNDNIAWFPLKFFGISDTFENTIQTGGIYAYKYKPSSDVLKEYGSPAYYMDMNTLKRIYGSRREVLHSNVAVDAIGLSAKMANYAQRAKISFINVLNTRAGRDNKYAQIPYVIKITYTDNKGHINLRVPLPGNTKQYGDDLIFQPDLLFFDALLHFKESWRLALFNEENMATDIIGAFSLSVTHYDESGEITVHSRFENGKPYFQPMIDFSFDDKKYRLKSNNVDEMFTMGMFTLPPETGIDGKVNEGVICLKKYLTSPDYANTNDNPGISTQTPDPKQTSDWKSEYDTFRQTINTPQEHAITEEPAFLGGKLSHFAQWVNSRIVYPQKAIENGIQGNVIVEFEIKKDGSISNVNILKSPDKLLSEEVVRIMETAPAWIPGKQDGVPVSIKYSMPISFKLSY